MRAAGEGGRPPTPDSQGLVGEGQPSEKEGKAAPARASQPLAGPLWDGEGTVGLGEQPRRASKEQSPASCLHCRERKGETLSS